jgi:hypothetical protein
MASLIKAYEEGRLKELLAQEPNLPIPCGNPAPELRAQDFNGEDDYDFEDEHEDRTCPRCYGTGGDPYDDGITTCDHCDGEGYEWWR